VKESDLHEPVCRWLEGQGYVVHAEVRHCDLLARKDDDLVVVELKTAFSLSLVYQGIDRQERADSVYLAIPVEGARKAPPRSSSMRALCRRLGLGLIVVRFLKRTVRIEVVLHPEEAAPRRSHTGRRAILREIDSRYAEFTRGGLCARDRHMSAYRQQALVTARLLEKAGESGPAGLVKAGAPANAGVILARNVYGWFDHRARGRYRLNPAGTEALGAYAKEVEVLEGRLGDGGTGGSMQLDLPPPDGSPPVG